MLKKNRVAKYSGIGNKSLITGIPYALYLYMYFVHKPVALTFANMVLPVPGGPYMSTLRYTPLLERVLMVDRASVRNLSSNSG